MVATFVAGTSSTSRFTGRERELSERRGRPGRRHCGKRLFLLSCEPGIGKTRPMSPDAWRPRQAYVWCGSMLGGRRRAGILAVGPARSCLSARRARGTACRESRLGADATGCAGYPSASNCVRHTHFETSPTAFTDRCGPSFAAFEVDQAATARTLASCWSIPDETPRSGNRKN